MVFRQEMGRKGPRFHNQGAFRQPSRGAARARAHRGRRTAVLGRLRARGGPNEELVRNAGERRARRARGIHRNRRVRSSPTGTGTRARYYDLLSHACFQPNCSPTKSRSESRLVTSFSPGIALTACSVPAEPSGTFAQIANPDVRRALQRELVDEGALVAVELEGLRGKRFVLADELALLESPPEPTPTVAFIAPFDCVPVGHEAAREAVFGSSTTCGRASSPATKRRWGY